MSKKEILKKVPLPSKTDSIDKWIEYVNTLDDEEDFRKDCTGYDYIPTMLPATERIVVLGDLHGDYKLAIKSLKLSKIIDNNLNWIATPPTTHVVQVGDQIDRCRPHIHKCSDPKATHDDEASDILIMEFLTDLDKKARKVGGRVINLLGNHEIMNSQGNMNYVSYEGLKDFKDYKDPKDPTKKFKNGAEARIHAFKPSNQYAVFMACSRLSSVIIGSQLFVHAAILPALMKKFKMSKVDNVRKVNSIIRKWLLDQIDTRNIGKLLNGDKISPFWPRVLGNIPPNEAKDHKDCKKYVEPVLKTLQIGKIIIGHTPQYYVHHEGINATCSDKLIRADIGSSAAFHPFDIMQEDLKKGHNHETRIVQVLEILNDKEFKIIEQIAEKKSVKTFIS